MPPCLESKRDTPACVSSEGQKSHWRQGDLLRMEVHHDRFGVVYYPVLEVAAILHVEGAPAACRGAKGPAVGYRGATRCQGGREHLLPLQGQRSGGEGQQPPEHQPLGHLWGEEELCRVAAPQGLSHCSSAPLTESPRAGQPPSQQVP